MARVQVGVVRVTVRCPAGDPLHRHELPITLSVIRIWEADPPDGVDGLEWILGTDRGVESGEDLLQVKGWYEWRWRTLEEYHKVQKTGCRIEGVRFETRERLQVAIALLSVVAVRMLQLRWQAESAPDAAVEGIASAEEVAALQAVRPGRAIVTVRQFVDGVAGLGGFLGRKCDGRPGWQALWRGYQRLADILLGFQLASRPNPSTIPSSG